MGSAQKGRVPWNKGISPSLEARAKMSASHTGVPRSLEMRTKMSVVNMGHVVIPETREKISATLKGNTNCLGRRLSEETKAKIAEVHIGLKASSETRVKMSLAHWQGGIEVSSRKKTAKRRALGFIPLNEPFEGCEGHHMNTEYVYYVPYWLHRSIYHNIWTGKGMKEINEKVILWLAGKTVSEGVGF